MKKNVKKNLIALFSVLAVGALTATGVNAVNATALALTDVENNFYVVDGASVLYQAGEDEDAKAGIRFQAVMTTDYYALASAETNVTYAIELYSALNDALLTTVDCTENVALSGNAYTQDGASKYSAYVFNATIDYGSLEGNDARLAYAFEMYAKAYVQVGEGEKQYASSNQTVRSMSQVAQSAYNDITSEYANNETLGAYFQNLTVEADVSTVAKLPDEDDDKQIVIDGLSQDTGAKTVYVGATELTGATVQGDAVILSDEDAGKVNVAQNYALTVLSDSGKTYSATFNGITKYLSSTDFNATNIGNTRTLLGVVENYFMLDGDVSLTETDFTVQVSGTYYVVRDFKCTLDGNGYTISVNASDATKEMTLFRDIWGTGVVKNIDFKCNAKMLADLTGYNNATFVMYITKGAMLQDCYFDSNVVLVNSNGTLVDNGRVSTFYQVANNANDNTADKSETTKLSNLVVDIEAVGGATYFAQITIGNLPVENCAFISNSENINDNLFTSAGHWKALYCYESVDAFIAGNGKKGVKWASDKNVTWTDSTNVIYNNWNAWDVNAGVLSLNGTQINVDLPARTVTATMSGSSLTTTDTETILNAYNVYAGETLVATVVGNAQISPSVLEKAGAINAGENAVTLTVKTAIGKEVVANVDGTLKVFGIDQTNFVTTVRTAQADVKTDYYYIMCSDVTLGLADYSTSQVIDGNYCVVKQLYVPFDGNGHTLAVEGDLYSNYYNAVFGQLFAEVQNLVFKYNATRTNAKSSLNAFFAMYVENAGSVKNCYLSANATYATNAGVLYTDTDLSGKYISMFVQTSGSTTVRSLQNVVVDINITNANTTAVLAVATRSSNNRVMSNVVLLGGNEDSTKKLFSAGITNSIFWNIQIHSCYYYATLSDFVNGINNQTTGSATTTFEKTTWTAQANDTVVYAYANWDSVWTIDATGIQLCGRTVYTVPTQA